MLKNFKYLFLLIFISCQFGAFAQSPYELSWQKDGIIGGAGIAIGIPSIIINGNLSPLNPEEINGLDKNNINGFDRFATNYYSTSLAKASDILVYTSIASPALLLISPEVRGDWTTVGTMYAETMLLAAALPNITKGLVKRVRPYAYNEDAPMSEKTDVDTRRSFFSGHTTIAFASAVFLSKVYSDFYPGSKYKAYVWGGSLLFATSVGLLRIFSGKHFPTDVLTGAVVGSLVGWLVPELHKKMDDGNVNMGVSALGISISYTF